MQEPPSQVGLAVKQLAWGTNYNLLAVNTVREVFVLREHQISAHYNQVPPSYLPQRGEYYLPLGSRPGRGGRADQPHQDQRLPGQRQARPRVRVRAHGGYPGPGAVRYQVRFPWQRYLNKKFTIAFTFKTTTS